MTTPLFCVCGRKGSGKDTLLEVITRDSNSSMQVFKLSSTLKDGVASFYGWDRNMLEGSTPQDRLWREEQDVSWTRVLGRPVTPRSELQKVGTEAMRLVAGENFWVHSMLRNIEKAHTNPTTRREEGDLTIFVGDCRFLNEIATLSTYYKVYVLYVERERDESLPYFLYMRDIVEKREKVLSETTLENITMQTVINHMMFMHPTVHRSEWETLLISLLWQSHENFIRITNTSSLEEYSKKAFSLKETVQNIVSASRAEKS